MVKSLFPFITLVYFIKNIILLYTNNFFLGLKCKAAGWGQYSILEDDVIQISDRMREMESETCNNDHNGMFDCFYIVENRTDIYWESISESLPRQRPVSPGIILSKN